MGLTIEGLADATAVLGSAVLGPAELERALGYDPMEFGGTLHSIAEGQIDVVPLITGSVGIDGVPQAFRDLADPEAHAKILVEPT